MNADTRATVYTALDEARHASADTIVPLYSIHGWTTWACPPSGMTATLPTLNGDAPRSMVLRYLARIIADLRGSCPLCEAVVSLSHDPERAPAAWSVLDVTLTVDHLDGCRAIFTDADRDHFDPDAWT